MESLFTEKSKNPKEKGSTKLDDITQAFKGSLDILNSINEISSMREKAGTIKHSYNVKGMSKRTMPLTNGLKKSLSNVAIPSIALPSKPVKNVEQVALRKRIDNSKKKREAKTTWKEPNMEEIYRTTLEHGEVDMYNTFAHTSVLKAVKSEFYVKPFKKLSNLIEKNKLRQHLNEEYNPSLDAETERERSTKEFRIRNNNSTFKTQPKLEPVDPKVVEEVQRVEELENDPKYSDLFTEEDDSDLNSESKGSKSTRDIKNKLGITMHPKIDINPLKKVLACVQTEDMKLSEDDRKQHLRGYLNSHSKFDLVINKHNFKIYESFIKKISMMNSVFPSFVVENLKDYSKYPLEDYDLDYNRTVNIPFYILQHPNGHSKWFENQKKKFIWEPCKIIEYDEKSQKFTIEWQRNGVRKQVRKLNLMFEDEDLTQMEERRMKANFFRCMHLLRLSLMNYMLGKEENSHANIFFSFQRFKNILTKTGLSLDIFNKNPEWMKHLEEMFDDFGISLIGFYIDWKTLDNLEALLEKYKSSSNLSPIYNSYYEECTTILRLGYKNESDSEADDIVNDIILQKRNNKEYNKKDIPKSIELSEYRLFDPLSYYGLSRDKIKLTQQESDSSSSESDESNKEMNVKGYETLEFRLSKKNVTYRSKVASIDQTVSKEIRNTSSIKKNTYNIGVLLENAFFSPPDVFQYYRVSILAKVSVLESINIFSVIEKTLKSDGSSLSFRQNSEELILNSLIDFNEAIASIKQELKYMCDELEPQNYSLLEQFSTRFKKFIIVLNIHVNEAIKLMITYSLENLRRCLRYMCLGLYFDYQNGQYFDEFLSPTTYEMRYLGMNENCSIPQYLQESKLVDNTLGFGKSDLTRRIEYTEILIINFFKKFHSDYFKRENLKEKSGRGSPLFATVNVNIELNFIKKHKKKTVNKPNYENIVASRDFGRKMIYNAEQSLKDDPTFLRNQFLSFKRYPTHPNNSIASKKRLSHVTKNVLADFLSHFDCLYITPSLSECESSFKKTIEGVIAEIHKVQLIKLDRYNAFQSFFDLSENQDNIAKLSKEIESFIADSWMAAYAAIVFLHSFYYLLTPKEQIISEEIRILNENNDLSPLREEILKLKEDLLLIERTPDILKYGLFKFDITKFRKEIIKNIEDIIDDTFNVSIVEKFKSLIVENEKETNQLKSRLVEEVANIEKYISMKKFLEGDDLKEKLALVDKKIKLCKSIYEFFCKFQINSEETFEAYLGTLHWVRDVHNLIRRASRKLKDSMPKFVKEIEIQGEKIFEEFERLENKIKKFDHYYELSLADDYCIQVKELNKQLSGIILKAEDINQKQAHFKDYKTTNFDLIYKQRAGFSKYVKLWTFISDRWNVGIDKWLRNPFIELDHEEMSETVNSGLNLLNALKEPFETNENIIEIITQKLQEIYKHQRVVDHVIILKHKCFKERHWDKLFEEMRNADKNSIVLQKKPDLNKITLKELLNWHLLNHYDTLKKILAKAKKESETEERIADIKKSIREISIKPQVFDLEHSGLSFIAKVKLIIARLNDHHSICQTMLANPEYPEEFSKDLNKLSRIIEYTKRVLEIIYVLQNKLIKFSPIFRFNEIEKYLTKKSTVGEFLNVRANFMKIMTDIGNKQMNYFIIMVGEGDNERINKLIAQLEDYDNAADAIYDNLKVLFRIIRVQCPRYFFLSEEQMLISCSLLKFPKSLMGFIATMFGGVERILVDDESGTREIEFMKIRGLVTKNSETIMFQKELEIDLRANAEIPLITIVKGLEKFKDEYFNLSRKSHLESIAGNQFNFRESWIYAKKEQMVFQVISLLISIVFDHEVMSIYAFSEREMKFNPLIGLVKLKSLLIENYDQFVNYPYRYLEEGFRNPEKVLFFNQYILFIKTFEEKLNYLIDHNSKSMSDFEFQMMPKYSLSYNPALVDFNKIAGCDSFSEFIEIAYESNSKKLLSRYDKKKTFASICPILGKLYTLENAQIYLNSMDMKFKYENEITTYNRNLAIWPVLEKSALSIFSALKCRQNMIIKGGSNQGKCETVRIISSLIAINYIECETNIHLQEDTILNLLSGVVSGGYWIMIKNLESISHGVVSILANYAETIQQKMMLDKKRITLGTNELLAKDNLAIFATFKVSKGRDEERFNMIPLNLLENFRVITLVKPNYAQIIQHLISFAMTESEAKNWTNKILLYSKMYKSVENFDFMLSAQEQHALAKSSIESEIAEIEVDMRVINFIIYVVLLFYFGKLDEFYKKFEGDPRYVFMNNDKTKIKVDFDKINLFTVLFKKTLILFFRKRGVNNTKLRLFGILFNKIFEKEIISKKLEKGQRFVWKKEMIPGLVQEFMDSDIDQSFRDKQKVISFCEDYVELLSRDPKGRQYIIYGAPDTQKSRFLKLLSFLESNINSVNFTLFWLNMECLDQRNIFGDSKFVGILREIFLRCHTMNMEENKTSNMKLNLLFQSHSELFHHYADSRGANGVRINREINNGKSWVVIDANSSKNNRPMFMLLEKLMNIVTTLNEHRVVNQYLGFSRNLRFFYEVNELSLFDPRSISENHLIYMNDSLISLHDRCEEWLSALKSAHHFYEMSEQYIMQILKLIIIPYIDSLEQMNKEGDLYFFISPNSHLNNFLAFLEIFLNELRKYLLIHDLLGSNILAFMAYGEDGNSDLLYGEASFQEKMSSIAKQSDSLSFISKVRGQKTRTHENDHLKNIKTDEDRNEFIQRKIEGVMIFSCVYSLDSLLLESSRPIAIKNIKKGINHYAKETRCNKQQFGDGVSKLLNESQMGGARDLREYCYDITKGHWIRWDHHILNNMDIISNDYSLDRLQKRELERLNCQNQKLMIQTLQEVDSIDPVIFMNLEETLIVDTATMKTMKFFLNYFNAYNKHTVLVSDQMQGKSTALNIVLKELIEQNKIVSFTFGMQASMSLEVVQKHIEDNLLKQGGNIFAPPLGKKVIIWLDDLNLSISKSKPESLLRSLQTQGGWFSLDKHNFTEVKEALFFMTTSIPENNTEQSRSIFSSINRDVLAKSGFLKVKRMSYDEFFTIFSKSLDPIINIQNPGDDEDLIAKYLKQLGRMIFFNKSSNTKISNSATVNLSLSDFLQFVKALEMIEWEEIVKDPFLTHFTWMYLLKNQFNFDISCQIPDLMKQMQAKTGKNYDLDLADSMYSGDDERSVNVLSPLLPSLRGQQKTIQRRMSLVRRNTLSKSKKEPKISKFGSPPLAHQANSSSSSSSYSEDHIHVPSDMSGKQGRGVLSLPLKTSKVAVPKGRLRPITLKGLEKVKEGHSQEESSGDSEEEAYVVQQQEQQEQQEHQQNQPQEEESPPKQKKDRLEGGITMIPLKVVRKKKNQGESKSSDESDDTGSEDDDRSSMEEIKSNDVRTIKQYQLRDTVYLRDYLTDFIKLATHNRLSKEHFNQVDYECINNSRLLFDMELLELSNEGEFERNRYFPKFEIISQENKLRMMMYYKEVINTFVYKNPEALFCLKLSGGNYPKLVNDLSWICIALKTPFRHLLMNTFKSSLYVRYLLGLAGSIIYYRPYYIDLLGHRSKEIIDDGIIIHNSYTYLISVVRDNITEIWNDKTVLIMLNIPEISLSQNADLLNKTLGFIDSIIFNSDHLMFHLGDRIKEIVKSAKINAMYSHYSENHLIYLMRNKICSRIKFSVIHEVVRSNILNGMNSEKGANLLTPTLKKYLYENYPKLSSRLHSMAFNGLNERPLSDTPSYYDKISSFSDIDPSVIFCKAFKLELNYIKIIDHDYEFLPQLRPFGECLVLYEQVVKSLYLNFESVESDVDSEGLIRDQIISLQKIRRRIELLQIEEKEIERQLSLKLEEIGKIEQTKQELTTNRTHFLKERRTVEEKLEALHNKIEGYQKENNIFNDLDQKLREAAQTLGNVEEKKLLFNIKSGDFPKSNIFGIYCVLFHKLYDVSLKGGAQQLTNDELRQLNEKDISLTKISSYVSGFLAVIEEHQLFQTYLKKMSYEHLDEETLSILGEIIQRTDNTGFSKWNEIQKCLMKWIDLLIEWSRFGSTREDRTVKVQIIEETIKKVGVEVERRDKLVSMIDDSLREQPNLIKTIQSKIELFQSKLEKAKIGIQVALNLQRTLEKVQDKYTKITSPFRSSKLNKDVLIELLACFIVFWSKYPYVAKKAMFLATIKSVNIPHDSFNEIPLFEILGTEQLLLEALKSSVPFNINMLNNVAISEFILDAPLPSTLIYDPSGTYLRWLKYRYSRNVVVDHYSPSEDSEQRIENALLNGSPYIIIDPNHELLSLISVIIDHKFKQFCESIIAEEELEYKISEEIEYNGKRLKIKSGFRLFIVLESLNLEHLDPSLVTKLIIINNEISEKRIWKETLQDEFILQLNADSRAVVVDDYLSIGLMSKIYDNYRELNIKMQTFDFLVDDLESRKFKEIKDIANLLNQLTDEVGFENQKRIEERDEQEEEKERESAAHTDNKVNNHDIENFMNFSCYYKVHGMGDLRKLFEPYTERFILYHQAVEKMGVYLGEGYSANTLQFFSRIKQVVEIFKNNVMSTSKDERYAFESNIAKIESVLYYQLMNEIPRDKRFLFSFILGILQQIEKAGDKKSLLLDHIRVLLFSEALIPNTKRNIEFSNLKLYNKFNILSKEMNTYFTHSPSSFPRLIDLQNDFELGLEEIKAIRKMFDTQKKLLEENETKVKLLIIY